MSQPLLEIKKLSVRFHSGRSAKDVVKNFSLTIEPGETVALVGASGSGKSVSALSVLRLEPAAATRPSGRIIFKGKDITQAPPTDLHDLRGGKIGMIFQEPMSSLNPLHTISRQIEEALEEHQNLDKQQRRQTTTKLLSDVGLDFSQERLNAWPHQLSGGQRQRVMIAMAIANNPDLLIADEPTTALDVTVQAQILNLLAALRKKNQMALFLISHDLDVVRKMADRVYVMHDGRIVETGRVEQVFENPQHPHTAQLIADVPSGAPASITPPSSPVVQADNLKVWFPIRKGVLRRIVDHVKAVDHISLNLRAGHCLAVVGESGSGKTSLGLALLKLIQSQGPIRFQGTDINTLSTQNMRALRPAMQIVFQDPYGSLSPRMTVGEIVTEGIQIHHQPRNAPRADYRALARDALVQVGLEGDMQDRYPHEFSGGQRQRIAIARAIALKPAFIVLDEPTSGLDMSVQARIAALLRALQEEYHLAYLFISHDLKIVRTLAHHIIVMKDGRVVEQGEAENIFNHPQHDYTKKLISAAFDLAF